MGMHPDCAGIRSCVTGSERFGTVQCCTDMRRVVSLVEPRAGPWDRWMQGRHDRTVRHERETSQEGGDICRRAWGGWIDTR